MKATEREAVDISDFRHKLDTGIGKSIELYNYGRRKFNIIHSQMRMCCSNLSAHLNLLHVTDDPMCICGQGIEDNEHFFLVCPLYYDIRNALLAGIRLICQPALEVILFGSSICDIGANKCIFDAVHCYIDKSGRFEWKYFCVVNPVVEPLSAVILVKWQNNDSAVGRESEWVSESVCVQVFGEGLAYTFVMPNPFSFEIKCV